MDISIFNWFGYVMPFEERIKMIKESGYDGVMCWWEDETYPKTVHRNTFIQTVKSYNLKLENIHLPFEDINSFWDTDTDCRNRCVNEMMQYMYECKNCGADTAVLHTSKGDGLVLNYSAGYKSFDKIIKFAEEINLKIAFENTQMFQYTDFILREFNSEWAGFCYDSSHDFRDGQSKGLILDRWKDKLSCVHLSDTDGNGDRHWIPGRGSVDWQHIINIIKKSKCKSFSMETYPFGDEKNLSPQEFLKAAKSSLNKIINI